MKSKISQDQKSETKDRNQIDWQNIRRVLVVRLRSIGDTVLATPSLIALRRFLPEARIDVLLEDWVAPVLDGFEAVDEILAVGKDKKSRVEFAWKIRRKKYDIVFNLHGGTTATFFVRASGAKYRVGFQDYQYSFLYTHRAASSPEFWRTTHNHSAEQQLALLGSVGVPVRDKPKSQLAISPTALNSVSEKLNAENQRPLSKIALIHPVAAFDTKQWATENFARVAEYLHEKDFQIIAVATKKEREVLDKLRKTSKAPILILDDLTLPEITALASKSDIFVGNDSGIAHIAAAVETPNIVIFGSSNINHWRPWTDAPNEIVYEKLPCQPCAGYFCKEFGEPECIKRISVESVVNKVEKILVDGKQ